jgi:hypothetical protein
MTASTHDAANPGARTPRPAPQQQPSADTEPTAARLQARLDQLRQDYASAQQVMTELAQRQAQVRDTLLRISGAIQVLEEMLGGPAGAAGAEPAGPPPGNGATDRP